MRFFKFGSVALIIIMLGGAAASPAYATNPGAGSTQALVTGSGSAALGSVSASSRQGSFWSPTAPVHGQAVNAAPFRGSSATSAMASPMYSNDLGCAGVPEGSQGAPPYYCRASAYNSGENAVIMVRVGSYGSFVYPDFGWTKFFYKHNLYLQPVLDTITYGSVDPTDSYAIDMYHYTNGNFDMEVRVIYNPSDYVSSYVMPDGNPVGVQTAYCVGYLDCPSWVNQTL